MNYSHMNIAEKFTKGEFLCTRASHNSVSDIITFKESESNVVSYNNRDNPVNIRKRWLSLPTMDGILVAFFSGQVNHHPSLPLCHSHAVLCNVMCSGLIARKLQGEFANRELQ